MPKKRKPLYLRKRGLFAGTFLALALGAAVFTISPWFFDWVVLPRFENGVNVVVKKGGYSKGWFQDLRAHDVTIRPKGAEAPTVTVPLVRLDYNPFVLLFDRTRFRRIDFSAPEVRIQVFEDGSSSLQPVFDAISKGRGDGKGPSFILDHIGLTNASIRVDSKLGGRLTSYVWTNGLVLYTNIGPDRVAGLSWQTPFRIAKSAEAPRVVAQGRTDGWVQFHYRPRYALTNLTSAIDSEFELSVPSRAYRAELRLRAGPSRVDEATFDLWNDEARIARASLAGPWGWSAGEGELSLRAERLDLGPALFALIPGLATNQRWGGSIQSTNHVRIDAARRTIRVAGEMKATNVRLPAGQRETDTAPPEISAVRGDYNVEWRRDERLVRIGDAAMAVETASGSELTARLTAPWEARSASEGWRLGQGEAELRSGAFASQEWPILSGRLPVSWAWERFSASIAAGDLTKESVPIRLNFEADGVTAKEGPQIWDGARLEAEMEGTWGPSRLQLDRALIEKIGPKERTARLEASGELTPGQATLRGAFGYSTGTNAAAAIASSFELEGGYTNAIVALKRLELSLTMGQTNREPLDLTLDGRLDFSRPEAMTGRAHVRADRVDLTSWAERFRSIRSDPSASASRADEIVSFEAAASKLVRDRPNNQFELAWEIGEIQFNEAVGHALTGRATLDGTRVQLHEAAVRMDETPINAKGTWHAGDQAPKAQVVLFAKDLPWRILRRMGAPAEEGLESATLTVELEASVEGFSKSAIASSLSGYAGVRVAGAEFRPRDSKEGGLFNNLADWLGAPAIKHPTLRWLGAALVADRGHLSLPDGAFYGDELAGFLRVDTRLDPDFKKTPIPSVPVKLYLATQIADELGLLAADPPVGATHVLFPKFVTVEGDFGNPQADVGGFELAGAVLEQFGEKVLGKDQAQYLYGLESVRQRLNLRFEQDSEK